MNRTLTSDKTGEPRGRLTPIGGFLNLLPSALYVAAHVMFLAIGIWLWARADDHALPYSGALLLYAASQLGFFAYFAHWITMKMAVLTEQMLMLAVVLLVVLRAT